MCLRVAPIALSQVPTDRPPQQVGADTLEHVVNILMLPATCRLDDRAPRELGAAARTKERLDRPLPMLGREREPGVVWLVLRAVWWSRIALYLSQSAREGCEKVTNPRVAAAILVPKWRGRGLVDTGDTDT